VPLVLFASDGSIAPSVIEPLVAHVDLSSRRWPRRSACA
jgi:hypothetical protein